MTATSHPGGVQLFDDDGTLLLTADLALQGLVVDGSTARANPSFSLNLSHFVAGPAYVPGSYILIDAFLGAYPPPFGETGGSLNLTLQTPGDFASFLDDGIDGSSFEGTYSGSLAPTAVIPESASLALVGLGLAGLGIARRQRR